LEGYWGGFSGQDGGMKQGASLNLGHASKRGLMQRGDVKQIAKDLPLESAKRWGFQFRGEKNEGWRQNFGSFHSETGRLDNPVEKERGRWSKLEVDKME